MKIRSITYFLDPGRPLEEAKLERAGKFLQTARSSFEQAGFEVQTARLATVPFGELIAEPDAQSLSRLARTLEDAGRLWGFDYVSLGPAAPDRPEEYALIPPALAETENVFFSGHMTRPRGGISLPGVRACARVIRQAAAITPDGFANLRFAALANVAPGAPFFPAAYHAAGQPAFALAVESADLAVQAFTGAGDVPGAQGRLRLAVEEHGRRLAAVAEELSAGGGAIFGGIDFSLAPFPELPLSLGTAVERLGVPAVGLHGSLAAAAVLADTLDWADFPHAGFSGLMLPVLEDATLARRAAEGTLTIKDLLLYSAVCGTGLDTVPLPGEVTEEALAALLLDVAVLSQRLGKPLTARLIPIPGKQAGDPTGFDFAYFANSRVMALDAAPLTGALISDKTFYVSPRYADTPQERL